MKYNFDLVSHWGRAGAVALAIGLSVSLSGPAAAQTDEQQQRESFIASNVLGAFYHELGHAVIDIQNVAVFGQEEDAADVFSVILIDSLFEDDEAEAIAFDVALQFEAQAQLSEDEGLETAWWSVHGPDEQRFYNTVCLFYGADPDRRADFATDLDLPEDRADGCPDEFDLALDSWGSVLDEMEELQPNSNVTFTADSEAAKLAPVMAEVMAEEVKAMNELYGFQEPLAVRVETCGEPNAFYDLDEKAVIMCAEYEQWFVELYELVE